MNIAFFLIHIQDLSGSGGAERFFADFFEVYKDQACPKHHLFFITDSAKPLNKIGKLKKHPKDVLLFKDYTNSYFRKITDKIPFVAGLANRLRSWLTRKNLRDIIVKNNIQAIHLPYYQNDYFWMINYLDHLPAAIRPKIILNITDCRIPYFYFSKEQWHINSDASERSLNQLFNNVKLDAVYSWYKEFGTFANKHKIIKSNPPITSITSRFVNVQLNTNLSKKQNIIVWASRLDEQKRPFFFLDAVRILFKRDPQLMGNWKLKMYGKGKLDNDIKRKIIDYNLQAYVEKTYSEHLPDVYHTSKCYVSTQDYENFPSLSMAEAMANANVIIARNVGQTSLFVRDGENGYLLKKDSPEGLADQLELFMKHQEQFEKMAQESCRLITEVHTQANFIKQTDIFWDSVLLLPNIQQF